MHSLLLFTLLFLLEGCKPAVAPLRPNFSRSLEANPEDPGAYDPGSEGEGDEEPSGDGDSPKQNPTPGPAPLPPGPLPQLSPSPLAPAPAPVAAQPPVAQPPLAQTPVVQPPPAPVAPPAAPVFVGAHLAMARLRAFYDTNTGRFPDPKAGDQNAWQAATGITAILDYMDLTGTREYMDIINNTFERNKGNNFLNDFYDDEGWWGLAWLRAYDLSNDGKYLDAARRIADDMMNTGWDDTCKGGIYWKKDRKNKNAIENELYIKLAAGIYNRSKEQKYLDNAKKAWNWFSASGLINGYKQIHDRIDLGNCQANDAVWTYNQGVVLGGLVELTKATGDKAFVNYAGELARASLPAFNSGGGVIREFYDPQCGDCNGDERLFKGAYVRNLRELNAVLNDSTIESFLEASAQSAWSKARADTDAIGFRWHAAVDRTDGGRQSSAVDLFNTRIKARFASNKALNRPSAGSGRCSDQEDSSKAVDGKANTKWCAGVDPVNGAAFYVELPSEIDVKSVRIVHAGGGGEGVDYNTKNFEILVGNTANGPWTEVVKVQNNRSSATFHNINKKAKFVRLHISSGGYDNYARIFEIYVE